MDWEERFSKKHPLNIKDHDAFLHGTSLNKYLAIQSAGLLLRKVSARNWGISRKGICFEKYVERGQYCGVVDLTMKNYCKAACGNDNSSEGVILKVKGQELIELGCPVYADWNKPYPLIRDKEGIPLDVDSNASLLSIIIIDRDVPIECLEVVRRIPFKD